MTVYRGALGAGRSFVELERCELECEKLRDQLNTLAAAALLANTELADMRAELEHLRRALWLAQHPEVTQTQEVGT